MKDVRAYHDKCTPDDEVVRGSKKRNSVSVDENEAKVILPFATTILDMKYRKAITEIKGKADYASFEDKLSDDEKNILNDIFTYTSKILTSTTRRDEAEEALDSLNRIIKDNKSLKTWALGMCVKFKTMLASPSERKSAQYYRTVVFNDIIENSAAIISQGKEKLRTIAPSQAETSFKFDMSVFDDFSE